MPDQGDDPERMRLRATGRLQTAAAGRWRWPSYVATRSSFASAIRLSLLLVAALLALLVARDDARTLQFLVAIIVLALVGTTLPEGGRARLGLLFLESLTAASGTIVVADAGLPLLVCLPSTTIAAGLGAGYLGSALTGGTAAGVLLVGRVLRADDGAAAFSGAAAQWVLVAMVSGLLAARIHGISREDHPQEDYAEAHRLLAQLRAVTRGLPGSLDPGTVAQSLLDDGIDAAEAKFGAVLLHIGGEQLVPLALHGYRRIPWRANLSEDGPITRAWLSGAPVIDRRQPDRQARGLRAGSTLLVLPVSVADSRVGVVTLEWSDADVDVDRHLAELADIVSRSALPLETAALFDELRIAAATEERSRLAREMHDGIAQDLAFLGYQLDALTALLRRSGFEQGVARALELRAQMTALISDLRLSISDLRSSVGPGRGLGAALSEYARSAGTSSGITVHLSLKEGSTRLPADAEVQLLRIAHDAVGRARRRPGIRNLWVTLDADPPSGSLVVEDDAPNTEETVRSAQSAAHALEGRALKLGARFSAVHRLPTGNRISVTIEGIHQ